jgi:L-alanine-DL-glutamate epimerase-like enolase superfamily enzyme
MTIASFDLALYRIELPVPLSDCTHGTMTHFDLVTVRLRDEDGAEGVGYTYKTGHGVAFDWKALEKMRAGGMP